MEHSEAIAALLRARITELEAMLDAHVRALDAVEPRKARGERAEEAGRLANRRATQPTASRPGPSSESRTEYSRPVAALLRRNIADLEAAVDVYRRGLAAVEGSPRETSRASARALFGAAAGELPHRRGGRRSAQRRRAKRTRRDEAPEGDRSVRRHGVTRPPPAQVRGATVPGPAVVPASSPPDDRAGGISAEDDPARGAVPADDRTSGGPPEARTVGKADRTGARPSEDDGASRRAARTRRTEDVSPDDVLAALRSGLSNASQIAVHLHVPAPLVRRRLRELERAGRVRRRPQTVR